MSLDQSGFYAGLRDSTVLSLLTKFGFDAAIQVRTGGVLDPVSGTLSSVGTTFVFPCKAVYGGGSSGKRAGVTKETEGKTLTRKTSKEVYLDASILQIEPNPDDLFQDENGNTFEIMTVSKTNPGGVNVLWRLSVVK